MTIPYIALLRGINVGGHTVKMDRLRALFAELGVANVRTYIQTGNVFFASDEADALALQTRIEDHLRAALGYAVPTVLRTRAAFAAMLAGDPFAGIEVTPDMRLAVSFMARPTADLLPLPYQTPDGAYEVVAQTPDALFVVWRLQNGRPGNSYGGIEKRIGAPTTTRFWHTAHKILAAAEAE